MIMYVTYVFVYIQIYIGTALVYMHVYMYTHVCGFNFFFNYLGIELPLLFEVTSHYCFYFTEKLYRAGTLHLLLHFAKNIFFKAYVSFWSTAIICIHYTIFKRNVKHNFSRIMHLTTQIAPFWNNKLSFVLRFTELMYVFNCGDIF